LVVVAVEELDVELQMVEVELEDLEKLNLLQHRTQQVH
jgi:hypothetical protein